MKKNRRLLHQLKTLIVSLMVVGSSVFLCAPMGVYAEELDWKTVQYTYNNEEFSASVVNNFLYTASMDSNSNYKYFSIDYCELFGLSDNAIYQFDTSGFASDVSVTILSHTDTIGTLSNLVATCQKPGLVASTLNKQNTTVSSLSSNCIKINYAYSGAQSYQLSSGSTYYKIASTVKLSLSGTVTIKYAEVNTSSGGSDDSSSDGSVTEDSDRVKRVDDFSYSDWHYCLNGGSRNTEVLVPLSYDFNVEKNYNLSFKLNVEVTYSDFDNLASPPPTFLFSDWSASVCGVDYSLDPYWSENGFSYICSFDFMPITSDSRLFLSGKLGGFALPSDYTTSYSFMTNYVVEVTDIVIRCTSSRSTNEILEDMEAQDKVTQDIIKDQTDGIMNGFNDSQGSSVNDSFSGHVNDYNTAEDSLFTSAKTGLNNFQMFDLSSVPAVVTGLSFVTSTMTSWFYSAGGADGVGIVLSVLFTVMIVAMALGLYKFYQGKHK